MKAIVVDPTRPEFRSTNLKTVSVVRLHKVATIHDRRVVRSLGRLDPSLREAIASRLRQLLGLRTG